MKQKRAGFSSIHKLLIMPTDLDAVSRRKREAQADGQTEITVLLVCVIISLGSLMLVFEVFRQ